MSRKEVRNQTTLHRTQFRVQHKTDPMRQQGLVRYGLTAEYQMFKTHLDELKWLTSLPIREFSLLWSFAAAYNRLSHRLNRFS